MKGLAAVACVLALAGASSGCAWWDAHGWKGHHAAAPATAAARAQCEGAVATLKGKPDYDSALSACLQEKARRGK
jgi:hypothetical protein